jgi:hypothetical protein
MPDVVVFRETMCCGYQRCPTVVLHADGSAVLTETGPDEVTHRIVLAPAQRVRLAQLLSQPTRGDSL